MIQLYKKWLNKETYFLAKTFKNLYLLMNVTPFY